GLEQNPRLLSDISGDIVLARTPEPGAAATPPATPPAAPAGAVEPAGQSTGAFTVQAARSGGTRTGTLTLPGGVKVAFAWIPEGDGNRKPFWMSLHEITQEQWHAVMGANPASFTHEDPDLLPVENVSWDDCAQFLAKLNGMNSGTFRLPNRRQWEYACRAGASGDYYFGIDQTKLGDYAWFASNSNHQTNPVGAKGANAWGLHDTLGNVWEWCADEAGGGMYEQCGGSWTSNAWKCTVTARRTGSPTDRGSDLGLRIIREP
ncbi:MAG: SUMF1/EgtB/PvdO family nonheme iron enzyme, partial [Candidatus Hydrogenedentes bacterium]|nr:SUMF1/EgtB/PvdO family nonheme iron enzyme [Candidatus Hydrogenedentota bacterium]